MTRLSTGIVGPLQSQDLDESIAGGRVVRLRAHGEAQRAAFHRLQSEIRANSQLVEQVNAFECQHGLTACPRASSCDCQPMAAEACTEIGADLSARELDAVFPLNRYFRLYPVRTWCAVVLVIVVLAGLAGAGDLPLEAMP